MKKVLVILTIFGIDRLSKIYLINLQSSGTDIDFYILPFLNFYLMWNTGIGFGLISLESNIYYHLLTFIILLINCFLIFLLFKTKGSYQNLIAIIIGGSLGNLFDRVYYSAVPDFIDINYQGFHWFVFNIADIFISLGIICLITSELFLKKESINKTNE